MTSSSATKREAKYFWVISYAGIPEKHLGFACQDDVWWFPSAGFSTGQIFDNKEAALSKAISEAKARLFKESELIGKLEKMK